MNVSRDSDRQRKSDLYQIGVAGYLPNGIPVTVMNSLAATTLALPGVSVSTPVAEKARLT
jgi:DNA-binding NarL/FixJ family response regulator